MMKYELNTSDQGPASDADAGLVERLITGCGRCHALSHAFTDASMERAVLIQAGDAMKEAAHRLVRVGEVDEATVERVARALCEQGGFDPDEIMANDGPRWRYYEPGARAAIAALRSKP
jgi:hypothetical protein